MMQPSELQPRRYLSKWKVSPANSSQVSSTYEYFELVVLELSPDRQFTRVLWETKSDGNHDQEWLPTQELAEAIVQELPQQGPLLTVPSPTAPRMHHPGMPWPR